jgi:YHS domain-containing protein
MKLNYLMAIAIASVITFGCASVPDNSNTAQANPCAGQVNPCAGANPCAASKKTTSAPPVYIESKSGLAIRGTDTVAYFTESKPVAGSEEFEYEWQGATWRFSSEENKNLFVENPEKYAPQYGGYCAQGLSEGNVVSTDPNSWKIVDGKLYLNYSPDVQKQWLEDVPGHISQADAKWPDILNGAKVYE